MITAADVLTNRIAELSGEINVMDAYVAKGAPNAHTWQPYIDIIKRERDKLTMQQQWSVFEKDKMVQLSDKWRVRLAQLIG
jgi:hypothetical protein